MAEAAEKSESIYALIPRVMAEVGAIGKGGYNSYDKYKFRSIDDMYNKLQPVLAKHGVFFVPEVIDSQEEKFESAKGTPQVRIKLRVKYHIFAKDGSELVTIVEGEAIDRGDKATNKALTAAFKYMLIQIFCIAIEGQEDADNESPQIGGLKVVKENQGKAKHSKPAPKPASKAKPKPAPKSVKNYAPGADTETTEFIIQGGKYAGMTLFEVPPEELRNYVTYIEQALAQKGQKPPQWFVDLKRESEALEAQ